MEPQRPASSDEPNDGGQPASTTAGTRPVLVAHGPTLAAALAVVAIVVVILFPVEKAGVSPPSAAQSPLPAEHGSACSQLKVAFDRRAADDAEGFVAAARSAAKTAEESLQRGEVIFGPPERVAIELFYLLRDGEVGLEASKIDRLSAMAQRTCTRLDRW